MFDDIIKDHPEAALGIVLLGALGGFALRLLEALVRNIFKRTKDHEDKRVADLEDEQETHGGAIDLLRIEQGKMNERMRAHADMVRRHMDDEEKKVWPRLSAFGERLARIEGSVATIAADVGRLLNGAK